MLSQPVCTLKYNYIDIVVAKHVNSRDGTFLEHPEDGQRKQLLKKTTMLLR